MPPTWTLTSKLGISAEVHRTTFESTVARETFEAFELFRETSRYFRIGTLDYDRRSPDL